MVAAIFYSMVLEHQLWDGVGIVWGWAKDCHRGDNTKLFSLSIRKLNKVCIIKNIHEYSVKSLGWLQHL